MTVERVCHIYAVIIDGVWIGNLIYGTLQILTIANITLSPIHSLCSSLQHEPSLTSLLFSFAVAW
jgi:hypothetical protein